MTHITVYRKIKIDRIDSRGNIREHVTSSDRPRRTLCGMRLYSTQQPCGNAPCKRCALIEAKRGSK